MYFATAVSSTVPNRDWSRRVTRFIAAPRFRHHCDSWRPTRLSTARYPSTSGELRDDMPPAPWSSLNLPQVAWHIWQGPSPLHDGFLPCTHTPTPASAPSPTAICGIVIHHHPLPQLSSLTLDRAPPKVVAESARSLAGRSILPELHGVPQLPEHLPSCTNRSIQSALRPSQREGGPESGNRNRWNYCLGRTTF